MWNEWDLRYHWTGSLAQLYQMITPAVAIIRQYIPTAVIMMPSTTPDDSCYASNLGAELNLDANSGPNGKHLSDWIDFHVYLTATTTSTNTPEVQWAKYIQNGHTSTACNSGQAGFLDVRAGLTGVSGWSTVPWVDSETNYDASQQLPTFVHPANTARKIARARWLDGSCYMTPMGRRGFIGITGTRPLAGTATTSPLYYNTMTFLTQNSGGKFTQACSYTTTSGIQTWTCNFTQGSGKPAQFVWTPSESGTNYSVPAGYGHYLTLTGGQEFTVQGGVVAISVEPIALIP